MFRNVNIKQILKALMLVLSVMFLLTACDIGNGKDDVDANDRTAMPSSTSLDDAAKISADQRTCWQTGLVTILYDKMGEVAMSTYAKITDGAMPLMMIAFALWTVFRLLKFLGSFTEETPAEIWNEILRKLFICFVCGWLASSTEGLMWVLNGLVFPIYNAFLEFGSEILAGASETSTVKITTGHVIRLFAEDIQVAQPVICKAGMMEQARLDAFPNAPKQMMECLICAVNERMSLGFALSFKVMAAPGFMATITGLLILGCFTFVKLGFAFYLVDSIFRFTMMAVILPILVMSYAFKATSGWVKHGLMTILSSASLMMFIAVMMAMALLAMEQVIMDNADIFDTGVSQASFAEFSIPFMCIMMIAFLITSSINIAQQMSGKLVGGSADSKIQKRVGKLAATIAKAVFSWITGGLSKIGDAIAPIRKTKNFYKKAKQGMKEIAGRE